MNPATRGFHFRLEAVRRTRAQARDVSRRAVAHQAGLVLRAEQRIAALNDELRETVGMSRDQLQSTALDVTSLCSNQFFRGWLQNRILEAQHERANEHSRWETERQALAEATKKLRVIEKLKDRRWKAYLAEQNRKEQAALDESALQAHQRRARDHAADGGESPC